MVARFSQCLAEFRTWLRTNWLRFNADKTDVMLVGKGTIGDEGRAKQTPSCNKNMVIVCSGVVRVLIASPFKTWGDLKVTSATLRFVTSLQILIK